MQLNKTLIALFAAFAASMVAPSLASADVADSYTGWGNVESALASYPAYRKVGSYWVQHNRPAGTRIYIAPYAAGWSWTYTASTGWLVEQGEYLVGDTADTTAPVLASVTAPDTTTSQTVAMTLSATDAVGVTQYRIVNEDATVWTAWKTYDESFDWTLTAGAGAKRVLVQVRDAAGNKSAIVTKSISYAPVASTDTTAPVLTTLTVPATTTSQIVAVTLSASDAVGVTKMRVANEGGTWSTWLTYDDAFNLRLTAGSGTKVLFVQVADAAGNVSNIRYQKIVYTAG